MHHRSLLSIFLVCLICLLVSEGVFSAGVASLSEPADSGKACLCNGGCRCLSVAGTDAPGAGKHNPITSDLYTNLLTLTLGVGGFILAVISISISMAPKLVADVLARIVVRPYRRFVPIVTLRDIVLVVMVAGLLLLFAGFTVLLMEADLPLWAWHTVFLWNIFGFIAVTFWLIVEMVAVHYDTTIAHRLKQPGLTASGPPAK